MVAPFSEMSDINDKDLTAASIGEAHRHIIAHMKFGIPVWEELLSRGLKLQKQLDHTAVAFNAFLEGLNKIADVASNGKGGTSDIGGSLSELVLFQKGQEIKLKEMSQAMMSKLLAPLQVKVEEWKRTASQIEREHDKELHKSLKEIQETNKNTLKTQKTLKSKIKKDKTEKVSILQYQMEQYQLEADRKIREIEQRERHNLNKVICEERKWYCGFVAAYSKALDIQVGMYSDVDRLNAILKDLGSFVSQPNALPDHTRDFLENWTISSSPVTSQKTLTMQGGSMASLNSSHSRSSLGSQDSINNPAAPAQGGTIITPPNQQAPGTSNPFATNSVIPVPVPLAPPQPPAHQLQQQHQHSPPGPQMEPPQYAQPVHPQPPPAPAPPQAPPFPQPSMQYTPQPPQGSQYHAHQPPHGSQYNAPQPPQGSQYHTPQPPQGSQYHAPQGSQYHAPQPPQGSQYHAPQPPQGSQYHTPQPPQGSQYHGAQPSQFPPPPPPNFPQTNSGYAPPPAPNYPPPPDNQYSAGNMSSRPLPPVPMYNDNFELVSPSMSVSPSQVSISSHQSSESSRSLSPPIGPKSSPGQSRSHLGMTQPPPPTQQHQQQQLSSLHEEASTSLQAALVSQLTLRHRDRSHSNEAEPPSHNLPRTTSVGSKAPPVAHKPPRAPAHKPPTRSQTISAGIGGPPTVHNGRQSPLLHQQSYGHPHHILNPTSNNHNRFSQEFVSAGSSDSDNEDESPFAKALRQKKLRKAGSVSDRSSPKISS